MLGYREGFARMASVLANISSVVVGAAGSMLRGIGGFLDSYSPVMARGEPRHRRRGPFDRLKHRHDWRKHIRGAHAPAQVRRSKRRKAARKAANLRA
jgi:hypothetical protein